MYVKAKKALGQHFLKEDGIAVRIVDSLDYNASFGEEYPFNDPREVLEVGPGTGVLTKHLLKREDVSLSVAEIDVESVEYLKLHYPQLGDGLWYGDFLRMNLAEKFDKSFYVIGNFPYNISSQIFFKVLDYREQIPQVVGMIQKEVAVRLASGPGNKDYGILSVLLQVWYDIEYLFTVDEGAFIPPPKVKSAVIKLTRNNRKSMPCSEADFKKVVKTAFNQRRKTIRNSVKSIMTKSVDSPLLSMRPEQLSVEQFIELTNLLF